MYNLERLKSFLKNLQSDIYPEIPGEPHLTITRQMIERLLTMEGVQSGQQVLDVGCGQGLAMRQFIQEGLNPTGIALGEDVQICQKEGLNVLEMDQSFLDFADSTFDIIWCRHALEHSVFPFFTLTELHRLLTGSGILYVEVPAPDTSCHHETNLNHYSVLGKSMWVSLFERAGFAIEDSLVINFQVPAGPDEYWAFFLRPKK